MWVSEIRKYLKTITYNHNLPLIRTNKLSFRIQKTKSFAITPNVRAATDATTHLDMTAIQEALYATNLIVRVAIDVTIHLD